MTGIPYLKTLICANAECGKEYQGTARYDKCEDCRYAETMARGKAEREARKAAKPVRHCKCGAVLGHSNRNGGLCQPCGIAKATATYHAEKAARGKMKGLELILSRLERPDRCHVYRPTPISSKNLLMPA